MSAPLRIHLASAGDAAEIAPVKVTGWRTAYAQYVPADVFAPFVDEQRVAEQLTATLSDPANFAILARRGDEPAIGVALCTAPPHLESLHVLPAERGGGVGSALLSAVAVEVERRGATALTVAVVEQNAGARRLYERLGAHRTGTRPAPWAPAHVCEVLLRWDDFAPLRAAERG